MATRLSRERRLLDRDMFVGVTRRAAWTALLAVMSASLALAADFTVTDLGTLPGGSQSQASGINASGQVVGVSEGPGFVHAFLWQNGTMTDLGALPGGHGSFASGINASGQVVGGSEVADPSAQHAFLWQNGTGMNDLGTLVPPRLDKFFSIHARSEAFGINASGQVVGGSTVIGGKFSNPRRAFLWEDGTGMNDLGTLPGATGPDPAAINASNFSVANAINASGQVVGSSSCIAFGTVTCNFSQHAFLWQSGTFTDLGTLGFGNTSSAFGINDSGQVVGGSNSFNNCAPGVLTCFHAFLWENGTGMKDLGTLPGGDFSKALGINDSGQVVGVSNRARFGSNHAFLWENGAMMDITPEGWSLAEARAINDAGQIVGFGVNPSGHAHAFLLTPVPEPATLSLLGLGLGGLLMRRRKRT